MQLASILSNILIIIIKKVTYGMHALDKLMLFQGSAKRHVREKEVKKEMVLLDLWAAWESSPSTRRPGGSRINLHTEFNICVSFKLNAACPHPSL